MSGWGNRWSDVPTRVRMRDLIMVCVAGDTESLEALRHVTRALPCRVLMTRLAAEALLWVGWSRVCFVLADQWLQDMSGMQLLTEVARTSPTTARFLLASSPDSRDQVSNDGATVHGVIGKPWEAAALKRTLLAILRWQEERSVELYSKPVPVERRRHRGPRPNIDDASRPSLA